MSIEQSSRGSQPFAKRTVLALVLFGFMTFLALLYFISAGDTGRGSNDGRAHAASNGINGFAGLVELLEINGYDVSVSRSQSAYGTDGLLVLTPPLGLDPEDLQDILDQRFYSGPTLIILPKWFASRIQDNPFDDIEVREGWVNLGFASAPAWVSELEEPYALRLEEMEEREEPSRWSGYALTGTLPTKSTLTAAPNDAHSPVVSDEEGRSLAVEIMGGDGSDFFNEAFPVIVVAEPDLLNNYGLADESRAALAMEMISAANSGEYRSITFDVTLNGLGGATNLLTLAFRPPFLAATICLILALIIVGWRAFIRFGPPLAERQSIAFGKRQLVTNGAGLILRARRMRLLAEPYIALMMRRIGRKLGMRKPNSENLDAAIARRFPDEASFAKRASALREAKKPTEILRAARALKELERKLEA